MKYDTDNNFDRGIYLIDSQNYSDRQLEYIYIPVEEVRNPKIDELDKLLDKSEKIQDWRTYYAIIDKWGNFVISQQKGKKFN